MAEEKNIRFRIHRLEDLGYTFQKPEESIPTDRIDFSMDTHLDVNQEKGQIIFILKPRFTSGKKEPKLIAELIFKVEFEIQNLNDVVTKKEEGFNIPDSLVVTLFSISYSTMRGVFYEKSRGTMAERLILPIIDPTSILQKEKEN